MLKQLVLLSLFTMPLAHAQSDHASSLGLDLNNESDVAVYMMLYQIGLKERAENLLGDDSCISFSRDAEGNSTLSFGMNTDAFATGTVDFNADNNEKYLKTKNALGSLFGFFNEAKYKPQIGVRSYADPQDNIMSKYSRGGAIDQRYGSQLFSNNSSNDPRFNTESKRRNYLLAYDRGQAFINNFFPNDLKDKVSTTPYNSPDLEVGNNQSNSDKYACPNRRSIVVDMKFNPNFKVESTPGAFTPAFQVARGASNYENILAAAFDAESKSLNDLPLFCRNGSTAQFLERSKTEMGKVRNTLSKTANLNVIRNMITQYLTPERNERTCSPFSGADRENCLAQKQQLIDAFSSYESEPNDKNLYELVASLTYTSDPKKKRAIRNYCPSSSNQDCQKYQSIVDSFVAVSDRIRERSTERNSSHFMDCFSNKLYYQKEFKHNPSKYLTPVVDLRDPQTGELRIDLNAENIPNTSRGQGFICQACGNGLKFADGKFRYSHRARSSHTPSQREDSVNVYNNIMNNSSSSNMYLMGQQKGLNVYIVKDCNVSDMDNIAQTSQMVSLIDLEEKKVVVSPGDCIFKPNVINSCVHAPAGEGDGGDDGMTYTSTVASFLTGKNLEISLSSNVDILNEVMTGLKDDYIQTCQIQDFEPLQATPKDIVDGILCENRGIHIPKPSFDAASDCPEVAASIQR